MTSDAPIRIDSRLEETAEAARRITERCHRHGVDEAGLMMLELCVVEALNNAVEHAYAGEPGHPIYARCERDADHVAIEILHYGARLDPAVLERFRTEFADPDPDDPESWTDSGRGLQIIHAAMDAVEVVDRDDGLHGLRMIKRLPAEAG